MVGTTSVAEPVGVRVYNFTVADDHTYFVEGFGGAGNAAPLDAVWVHNTCAGAGGAPDESPRPDSGPAEAEELDKEGEAAAGAAGAGTAENAAATGADAAKQAQEAYPNKTGKEFHHITPRYLGGAANGPTVELDAAYHQLITNEFRRTAPYGQDLKNILSPAERQQIIDDVYAKLPLPPGTGH